MKLYIDTNNPESIHLEMTEDEETKISESFMEISFGLASLVIDYLGQTVDSEDYQDVKEKLMKTISLLIDKFLEEGVLDKEDDDEFEDEQDDLEELLSQMSSKNFTDEEIDAVKSLIHSCGSIEEALDYLNDVCDAFGIDTE